MKLAVMQPYLFPYIGYFQLIHASDLFLIYDDVTYIKRGYINRNRILSRNGPARFTLPVPGASPNKLIAELRFSEDVKKILKTIEHSYSKAPYFEKVFLIIKGVLEMENRSIASVCQKSYEDIFFYLGVKKHFKKTSELEYDRSTFARNRLITLCQKFGADCYINTPGGRKLYTKEDFSKKGVDLKFIDPLPLKYPQGANEFIPNLSIIDIMMHCSPAKVAQDLCRYKLS